jgi:16S rRNA (adenine1518-N6/adenine1519-N6)-dimethyltransferase
MLFCIYLHLQLKAIDCMHGVIAKKSLGQHFLTDKNIAHKIVDSILPGNYKTLIEVGPGKGSLTEYLFDREAANFIAVEIDNESMDYLKQIYPQHQDRIVHADFLKFPLNNLELPIAIIGNFPYYISSQILFKVLDNRNAVDQVVCMIQKEVAERIATGPGSKKYGILSVLLQTYYDIEYLFTVNEKCFAPPPKVKSAVIRLTRNTRHELECDPVIFFKVVKATFNQRRKIIKNSLLKIFKNVSFESEMLMKRPEQLSIEQFQDLTLQLIKINPLTEPL